MEYWDRGARAPRTRGESDELGEPYSGYSSSSEHSHASNVFMLLGSSIPLFQITIITKKYHNNWAIRHKKRGIYQKYS